MARKSGPLMPSRWIFSQGLKNMRWLRATRGSAALRMAARARRASCCGVIGVAWGISNRSGSTSNDTCATILIQKHSPVATLLERNQDGLYCAQGDFYIDPWGAVERALITHSHSDHLYAGSKSYL